MIKFTMENDKTSKFSSLPFLGVINNQTDERIKADIIEASIRLIFNSKLNMNFFTSNESTNIEVLNKLEDFCVKFGYVYYTSNITGRQSIADYMKNYITDWLCGVVRLPVDQAAQFSASVMKDIEEYISKIPV